MAWLLPPIFLQIVKVRDSVNCMTSSVPYLLVKSLSHCNLHPYMFRANGTHLVCNSTFPQGSPMTLIFAMCLGRGSRGSEERLIDLHSQRQR